MASRALPNTPSRIRAARGTRTAPDAGTRHLPGARPGPGQDIGSRVGLAQQGPRLGRTGPWGAGDGPCCGLAEAGTDGPRG